MKNRKWNELIAPAFCVAALFILQSCCPPQADCKPERPAAAKADCDEIRAVGADGEALAELVDRLEENIKFLEDRMGPGRNKPQVDDSQTYNFDLAGAPFMGPEDARLTLVVFSDFQCPYCKRFAQASHEIVEKMDGDLKLVFMNFQLHNECNDSVSRPMHPQACLAANAAMAANAQGKFWEMHDHIFENSRNLTSEELVSFAQSQGMDGEKIRQAIENNEYKDVLNEQAKQLLPTGSRGTPTAFLNGRKMQARWDDVDSVVEFLKEQLEPGEKVEEPAVKPAVDSPGDLPAARVVLDDGTRLEERLSNLAERMDALGLSGPKRPSAPKGPDPKREYKFNLDKAQPLGKADAPVSLVVFSNFTCPHCANFAKEIHEIHKKYPERVKIYFKNVPNQSQQASVQAHMAAVAAQEQGKFWEMHDKIFDNRKNISDESLKQFAQDIGLDLAKYQAGFEDKSYIKVLADDLKEADSAAVKGTPTLFINGKVQADRSMKGIEETINKLLEK